MVKGLAELCIKSGEEQPEVCTGILNNYVPIIVDVLIQSDFTPTELCGYFKICSDYGSDNQDIVKERQQSSFSNPHAVGSTKKEYKDITTQEPLVKNLKTNSTIGYFLQLTDIHFDPDYKVGSNPNCGRPLCCRDGTGDAGVIGHYLCDIPLSTVQLIFNHLQTLTDQIDFIIWTGDNPPHNVWEQSQTQQEFATQTLAQLILKTFPNTPVFPVIGNHEAYPSDQYVLPNTQWLLDSLYTYWMPWLDTDALESVKEYGYYTTLLRPGLRVMCLNTLENDMINFYNLLPTYLKGPNNQSDWMINTLEQAEGNGEKVLILGHIPCTVKSASTDQWCAMYEQVVSQFSDVIVGQIYGHTHYDQFNVFSDVETHTKPTGMNYIAPSMTTYQNHEPGYRIYEFDYSTNQIINYYQYHANITDANKSGQITFDLIYSAKELYNLPDLTPASWYNLATQMKTNTTLFMDYFTNLSSSPDKESCDQSCQTKWVCQIFGITSTEFDKCYGV
ncbi:hypothetical protein DICPUDRAFT_52947 [Dictyostelium purpureum]|uniref:Saposin B-type domain-containing protein n=1 Tax=Dictyostelium purpureum TaxID=5786 RepID=F0ZAK3_DICPU|nr:uncharacterized protein DICPUDRAFT_52947 [Dictyostelium purpureum]EGC39017.1 hypothetical protein DICPUDRAFT_52947 [Dictyostelium purpureum]|eukprot:XP_003284470.1 hypothetical protein DICPUDRAFT_52947 [Dictyostelium purpureum]